VDPVSITDYLKNVYVLADRTINKNVFTLPPAHSLALDGSGLKIWRYWNLAASRDPIELNDAVAEFRRLFRISVEKQLVADVPAGAFLSGGLDSSTVVAEAARLRPKFSTISFGFEDSENEHHFARDIAEKYGTTHHELTAQDVDLGQLLLRMDDVFDEPFGDSSNIPTFLISQLARQHMKLPAGHRRSCRAAGSFFGK
jgi:asparagine synthase (glutamine-hydrolysing)